MVVNGAADTGTLTWNSNGTLGQMAISDGISGSTDSETCNYGYDDLERQSSVNCGTGWAQNFSYDAFGNIAKTVPSGSTGSAFSPTYSSATNQFTSIPGVTPGYDLDGRLLTDNVNTYTWDPWGDLATVNGSSAETYDAFGHLVETNFGELVYGPSGKWLAIASGSTLLRAFMPLAAGSRAVYGSSGLLEYMTADWEGSDRLASTPSRTASTTEYAPFGETYGSSGDDSYTGQLQTTVTSLLDFPARRYSPSQGRWISPDPLGVGAVTVTNPQSWNRYAYVLNNPMASIDPLGLEEDACDDGSTVCYDGFSGGGGGGGGDDGGGGGGGDDGGDVPPDCNSSDTVCVNGDPPSCDPSNMTCQVQNPGVSQPIPGAPTSPQAPNNGQLTACQQTILNAVNNQFGTNLTAQNVLPTSDPNPTAGGGQVNVNFGGGYGLSASQFNAIQSGRYAPPGFFGFITGYGPSLHVVAGPSGLDPTAGTFQTSNFGGLTSFGFTAHIDSAWAYNPFGAFLHWLIDVRGHGSHRKPC
jgi:RHS repeat-associated protein